jgi:hypothetical protein
MNDVRSATGIKGLLEAAKCDGPASVARAKIWGGVIGSVGASVSAGMGGAGAAKMLVGGTLLGATVTVGLAATIIYITGAGPTARAVSAGLNSTRDAVTTTAPAMAGTAMGTNPGAGAGAGTNPGAGTGAGTGGSAGVGAGRSASIPGPTHPGKVHAPEDALAHEAALVDQARSALARGDARGALRAVRAAGGLRERQLWPEELTVEQQALRKLGRIDQADAVEADLKAQYPESALAR